MVSDGSSDTVPVIEVEFSLHDPRYPYVAISESEECLVELVSMIPRGEGRYAEFFTVTGTAAERVTELVESTEGVSITLLRKYDDGGLFEFLVTGACPAVDLAELGALPRSATAIDGEARMIAEIPPGSDPGRVITEFLEQTPDATLESKREKDAIDPLFNRAAAQELLFRELTPRQREVLRTAFDAGYYEWPRRCTGCEVAAQLDISSATFSEHIHTAERKLLATLFDQRDRS